MVIFKTCGGLGNQLFQYAAALELAYKCKQELVVDLEFQNSDKRNYELNKCGIHIKKLPIEVKKKLTYQLQNRILKFYKSKIVYTKFDGKIAWKILATMGVFFCRRDNQDIPPTLLRRKQILLAGSFSNDKYFSISSIQLRKKLQNRARKKITYSSQQFACIHIRRGDYVNNPVHEVCTDSYYCEAMKVLDERVQGIQYIVFSDDPDDVEKNMLKGKNYFLDREIDSAKALFKMINCNHYIISNSTFSWWAQYLNTNPDKIVVAPRQWYRTNQKFDLYDSKWIRINT